MKNKFNNSSPDPGIEVKFLDYTDRKLKVIIIFADNFKINERLEYLRFKKILII